MKKILIAAVGLSLLSGCSMKEFSSTPFYEGNTVKYTGAVEDRVNLWPVAYWREPVGSVAWPLVSFGSDHFALRPLYSQYKKSGMGEYDEYNVLWPIAQFDTDDKDYRIFPFFWGRDFSKDPYFCLFPIAWYNDEFAGAFPFFWSTDKDDTGFCVFPLFWMEFNPETFYSSESLWHTLFPIYYYESCEAKGDGLSTSKFWTLCGLAGYNRRGGEFTEHRFWPLYRWERGNFYSIPYARYQRDDTIKNRFLLGLAGQNSNTNGEYMASWVFPLYYHNKNKEEFLSPLYGSSKDSSWLLPLYYRDSKKFITPIYGKTQNANWTIPLYYKDNEKLITALGGWNKTSDWVVPLFYKDEKSFLSLPFWCAYGDDGKINSAFSLPLLSGYCRDVKRKEKLLYALMGFTGFVESDAGSASWVFPLYYNDPKSFYTLLYGHNDECQWLAPLFYRDETRFLTPLYGQSKADDSSWLIPLYYKDKDSFITPLYGRAGDNEWLLPLYTRDKTKFSTALFSKWNDEKKGEKGFFSLPILSGANRSTNSEKSYWYALAGLAGSKTDATGKDSSQWAFPVFLRDKDKGFYSLPYSWDGGRTSQTNRYFACGLAGTRSGKTEGGWLFPVFDYKKDKSFKSLLYSWDGGGTTQTNSYYALSLAGKRSGRETGWWLFPFYNKEKDADYDKEYAYLDMDKLPEEIKIWDAVYTNWTWNAKKDCREIESVEPIKRGTYFYSYNNADLCLVSDNDRNVSGSVPWKGKVYEITYEHDQGNRLAYRYEGERKVTFDINTRKKISDVEEGESSLFFFLYNASHKRDRMTNKSYASRKVLLKLWDWEEENGDVSLDVFPGFTYDSKTNGYTKTSFLWRFFRYESDPKEGTSVDLLFIPVWR